MADRGLQEQQQTIRIPVYGEARYGDTVIGQQFINCFPEVIKDPTTGEGSVRVNKRPGMTTGLDLFATSGAAQRSDLQALTAMVVTQLADVNVVAMADITANKIYIIQFRPNAGTSTLVGTISSTSEADFIHIQEAQLVSAGTVYAGITVTYTKADRSASKCYWARGDGTKLTAASLTQIVAAAFPDQLGTAKVVTGPMIQMNGIFYVYTTDGTIYNSGSTAGTENDPTLWNSLSTLLTYQYPDGGIGLYRYKHHIIAVGSDSIEFFNDIGNPPPACRLERTEQAFIKFGAIHSMAVANIDDNMYWLAYGSTTSNGLWKLDGYSPVKLSTAKEDARLIVALGGVVPQSRVKIFATYMQGKKHLIITAIAWASTICSSISNATYGKATDTYLTGVSSGQQNFLIQGSCMMYSLEDKIFWAWSSMQCQSSLLIPTMAYPGGSTAALGYYKQYVFIWNSSNAGATTGARSFSYNATYIDDNPDGSDTVSYPVACAVQFNGIEFENSSRKSIAKVTAVFEQSPTTAAADTGIYSMSLFYVKTGYVAPAGTNVTERVIDYPNVALRYYWNNLGMSRRWDFCIVSLNKNSFFLKGLELKVSQGTH